MKSSVGRKLILVNAVVSALVTASVGLIGGIAAERLFHESYTESQLHIVRALAAGIDGDEHRHFITAASAGTTAYDRIQRLMRGMRAAEPDILSLYTINLDPATGALVYAVGADPLPGTPLAGPPEELARLRRIIGEGRELAERNPRRDGRERFLSMYGIIRDGTGRPTGAVRIDLSERGWERLRAVTLRLALGIALFAFCLALGISLLLIRYLTAPLKRLREAVNRIRDGELEVRLPVDRRDELGQLASDLNAMAGALQQRTRELAESEERSRAIGEAFPYGYWSCGPDGRIRHLDRSFLELVGMGLDRARRCTWADFMHPDDRKAAQEGWLRCLRTGEEWVAEYRVRASDGGWRNLLTRGRPTRGEDGSITGWAGVHLDIGDRKDAERQLQELTASLERRVAERTAQLQAMALALTRTEQEERRRLARFLHDHLQQFLVAARYNTQLIGLQAAEEGTRAAGRKADELIAESMQAIRAMSVDLSPPIVYEKELDSILRWLAEQMAERHGLRVEVDAAGWKGKVAEPIRIFVFQAVRELLFNTVKHAGVLAARVHLSRRGGRVRVEVSDEGAGFDPEFALRAAEDRQEFGLFSIQERLKMLGGGLTVESAPGRGCRFTLTVSARSTVVRAGRRTTPARRKAARPLEADAPQGTEAG